MQRLLGDPDSALANVAGDLLRSQAQQFLEDAPLAKRVKRE